MRELKFRTWNWLEGLFDKDPAVFIAIGGELTPSNNRIIEQYTGLKDKNGKEIYEGDIVREVIDANLEEIDGEYEYIVQWSNEFKQLVLQTTPKNKMFFHDELYQLNMSCEVIGNIHENPELLEDKK